MAFSSASVSLRSEMILVMERPPSGGHLRDSRNANRKVGATKLRRRLVAGAFKKNGFQEIKSPTQKRNRRKCEGLLR
jgi:hypothetical protein